MGGGLELWGGISGAIRYSHFRYGPNITIWGETLILGGTETIGLGGKGKSEGVGTSIFRSSVSSFLISRIVQYLGGIGTIIKGCAGSQGSNTETPRKGHLLVTLDIYWSEVGGIGSKFKGGNDSLRWNAVRIIGHWSYRVDNPGYEVGGIGSKFKGGNDGFQWHAVRIIGHWSFIASRKSDEVGGSRKL